MPETHRIVWLTDIHLNFVQQDTVDLLINRIDQSDPSAVLIGGDIAESNDVVQWLVHLEDQLSCPIYFVLGNHDFYFSSIARVRAQIAELCRQRPRLVYLSQHDPVQLTADVGLVGHDGWGDARAGDFDGSPIILNDYTLIDDFREVEKPALRLRLEQLGEEAAGHIRRVLPAALDSFRQVFVLTHVPPFREACWHQGHTSDEHWAPHFTCQSVGEAVLASAKQHPDRRVTVLCGHTHSPGETSPLDNVTVLTGGAEYRRPDVTRIFTL